MHIIFDLDGTISDSSQGVIQTLKMIFDRYNLEKPSDGVFKKYIGPPIEETLAKYMEKEKISQAVELYRKLYKDEGGIYKNNMYKGIDKLISYLKEKGHNIYLATTKEVTLAKETLENFGILKYFEGVAGANPHKKIYTKTDVLNDLFLRYGIDKKRCILIGDTMYDVNGAKDTGIRVGVVLYGFGKKQNFERQKIEFFANNVKELYQAIEKIIN